MKAQMKAANRSGAAVAVIVGDDERADGTAVVRPLRGHERDGQAAVARTDLLTHLEALADDELDLRPPAMRTHCAASCARATSARPVSVCGWVARRREHGEHLAFVDVRDHPGVVQCVVDNAIDVRSEYVVRVTGIVRARPEGTVNAEPADRRGRDRRLHRRGAARRRRRRRSRSTPAPTRSTRTSACSTATSTCAASGCSGTCASAAPSTRPIRRAMEAQGFVEVETPMLVPSTPEGAREFLVPSRKEPGSFYALPQSPQLFKQLLMVAGVDRYYQIARCLRDEDLRADRQYEFMQLDAEMSFVDQDDVLAAISKAVLAAAEAVTGERPPEIERITWHEAMDRFGVDKPDLRFGLELVELTDVFAATEFKAFAGAAAIKGIRVPGRRGRTAATSSTSSPTGPSRSGPRASCG